MHPHPCTNRFDAATVGEPQSFVGTPDFAATAALLSVRPGLRDDCEALGYTFLDLALDEMPW